MLDLPTFGSSRIAAMIRRSSAAMTRRERTRVIAMFGVIAGLHLLGFLVFFACVVPSHYKGLGIGVSILAYTLGLRHAFDADHISAIDNTIRKLLSERRDTCEPRPFGLGFFFSLGHSTVVVAIGIGIVVAEKTVFRAVSDSGSGLEQFGGVFGTVVSASFLLLIGLLNLFILAGIARVFRSMRRGEYDEAELERQLENRGFFYRFFGRWTGAITKEWQLYPVGVVFGLGFDTATEVALLATTALLASQHIAWYAILCLPILFTAGMTLMDTIDGLFMNLAYGWAFFNPVRKVYYNLTITGLSVAICFFIGGVEVLGLLPQEIKGLSQSHGFWGFMANFNINTAGFVIVGMFIVTWLGALLVWRYGQIEKRWSSGLRLDDLAVDPVPVFADQECNEVGYVPRGGRRFRSQRDRIDGDVASA
jgi:nickel/cobalt transporter (NiCoT) family protein